MYDEKALSGIWFSVRRKDCFILPDFHDCIWRL